MTPAARGKAPRGVRRWDVERLARDDAPHETNGAADARPLIALLEARKIPVRHMSAKLVGIGDCLRLQGRWYRVLADAHSPYGSRWKCEDVAHDGPPSEIAWCEVKFVARVPK